MIQVAVVLISFDMVSFSPSVRGRAGLGPIHLRGEGRLIRAPAGSHSKADALTMARRRRT